MTDLLEIAAFAVCATKKDVAAAKILGGILAKPTGYVRQISVMMPSECSISRMKFLLSLRS